MTDVQQVVKEGIKSITDRLVSAGVKIDVTDEQIELIGKGVIALVDIISNTAVKKSVIAGQAGADSITTVEQANTILKAAADKEIK